MRNSIGPFTRGGAVVGGAMAFGSLFGIGVNSILLKIEADDVRAEAESQLGDSIGSETIRDIAIDLLDDRGTFDEIADEVEARKRTGTIVATITSLGMSLLSAVGVTWWQRRPAPELDE